MRKFCTNPAKKHLHDFFRVVLFNVAKDGKLVKSGATWRQDFVSIGGDCKILAAPCPGRLSRLSEQEFCML